jgi:hypothetical protein
VEAGSLSEKFIDAYQHVKDKDKSQDNIQVQIQKSLQDKASQDKDYTVTTDKHQSS